MDKKSKLILTVLILLIVISIYLLYHRSFIAYDYVIIDNSDNSQELMTE